MSSRSHYYEELFNKHLDGVENLLIKFEQTRKEAQQLREKNRQLTAELSDCQSELKSLKNKLEQQTTATVELTGDLEKKFKRIMDLAEKAS